MSTITTWESLPVSVSLSPSKGLFIWVLQRNRTKGGWGEMFQWGLERVFLQEGGFSWDLKDKEKYSKKGRQGTELCRQVQGPEMGMKNPRSPHVTGSQRGKGTCSQCGWRSREKDLADDLKNVGPGTLKSFKLVRARIRYHFKCFLLTFNVQTVKCTNL